MGYLLTQTADLSGKLDRANAQLSQKLADVDTKLGAATTDIKSLADATGIPIGDPAKLQEVISQQRLVEAARKEGKLSIYSVRNVPVMDALVQKFREKYPFIEVEVWRGAATPLLERVTTEVRGGVYTVDMIQGTALVHDELNKQGTFLNYVPPETKAINPALSKPEHSWGVYVDPIVLAFNTNKAKADQLPKTWLELIDPKWTGKFGIGDPTSHFTTAELLLSLKNVLKNDWDRFVQGLVALKPKFHVSLTPVAGSVAAGDVDIGLTFSSSINVLKKQGAAVGWVFLDPTPSLVTLTSVAAKAPHPNAAKLFQNWQLSFEGQQTAARAGEIPVRSDVTHDFPEVTKVTQFSFSGFPLDEVRAAQRGVFKELFG